MAVNIVIIMKKSHLVGGPIRAFSIEGTGQGSRDDSRCHFSFLVLALRLRFFCCLFESKIGLVKWWKVLLLLVRMINFGVMCCGNLNSLSWRVLGMVHVLGRLGLILMIDQ